MTSVLPVETILKVEDEPLKTGNASNKFSANMSSETPVFISVGIQCSPVEPESKQHGNCTPLVCNSSEKCIETMNKQGTESQQMFIKPWPLQLEANANSNTKLVRNNGFAKPYSCSLQPFSFDEEIFLQLDYKSRNKLKTKQRRQDPFYRDQERMRQRAVMQLKRQDPCFRAIEREKGRCRMRMKRLDPVFRSQERERQRERMKLKRQDPNFRERERELQKNRIHEKRLNPDFYNKEKAPDHVCLPLKHNCDKNSLHSFTHLEQNKLGINSANANTLQPSFISVEPTKNGQNNRNISCSSNHLSDVKPVVSKEDNIDPFNHRTSHVFNLHIYNDGPDAWHNSAEKLSKATLLFNMFKDDIHQQNILTSSVNNCGSDSPLKARTDYVSHGTKPSHLNDSSVAAQEISKEPIGIDPSSSVDTPRKISKKHMALPPQASGTQIDH